MNAIKNNPTEFSRMRGAEIAGILQTRVKSGIMGKGPFFTCLCDDKAKLGATSTSSYVLTGQVSILEEAMGKTSIDDYHGYERCLVAVRRIRDSNSTTTAGVVNHLADFFVWLTSAVDSRYKDSDALVILARETLWAIDAVALSAEGATYALGKLYEHREKLNQNNVTCYRVHETMDVITISITNSSIRYI